MKLGNAVLRQMGAPRGSLLPLNTVQARLDLPTPSSHVSRGRTTGALFSLSLY